MIRKLFFLLVFSLPFVEVQAQGDTRCMDFMGIPLEGPIDSFVVALKEKGFTEWGGSADQEDLYFRGNYYGIRAKVMVNVQLTTRLVQSVYVTIGPLCPHRGCRGSVRKRAFPPSGPGGS